MKYVWYKLESHFGPGHQGTEIRYFYWHHRIGRTEQKEMEREEANEVANRYYSDSCITRMQIVRNVPQTEIDRLRSNAERSIRNGQAMLVALKELDKA